MQIRAFDLEEITEVHRAMAKEKASPAPLP